MSCTSSASGSQQPSNAPLTTPKIRTQRGGGCAECNSQLWSSYVVGLLACFLVVGGIFLAFHRWDYLWLAVSGVGVLLILVGASLHYCGASRERQSAAEDHGNRVQKRKRGSNHHRIVCEVGNQNERLLPSAPPSAGGLGNTLSVSQLSLNMLPPFFSSYDTVSLGPTTAGNNAISSPVSPVMHLNGQSFLLLPLGSPTSETSEANSLVHRLSTHLAALEQQSFQQTRCTEAVNFGIAPCLSSFGAFNSAKDQIPGQQAESVLNVTLPTDKDGPEPLQDNSDNVTDAIPNGNAPNQEVEEEPIYQVPRSPSAPLDDSVQNVGLNSCDNPVVDRQLNSFDVPDTHTPTTQISEEECVSVEDSTHVDESQAGVQEISLPIDTTECLQISELTDTVETTHQSHVGCEEVIAVTGDTDTQHTENSEQESCRTEQDLSRRSRTTTPEPDWTLPPSYDEVAPPNFKRLGQLKFAYETM